MARKKPKIKKPERVKKVKLRRLVSLVNVTKRKAEGWKVIEKDESTPDLVLMEK